MCDGRLGRLLVPDVAALRLLGSRRIDGSDLFLPVVEYQLLLRRRLVADRLFQLLVELLHEFFLFLGALARLRLKRQNNLGMLEKRNTGKRSILLLEQTIPKCLLLLVKLLPQ